MIKTFMEKARKRVLLAAALVGGVMLGGCADAVVMSPEDEQQWMREQIELYADVELPDFSVETVDGQNVTKAQCFENYDLVMVNIWGTFCGPCVEEMPDLARLYHKLPDGVNMITICVDVKDDPDNLEQAKKILKKANADFDTLIPDETLEQALTERVNSFPTTLFMDEEGKVVGAPYFGASDEKEYLKAIEQLLKGKSREEGETTEK